jgi:hypothetical protein
LLSDSALSDSAQLGTPAGAAIENEIPSYRAITPAAVGSLVFGLSGILCYVNLWFLAACAVAVLLGAIALRKIKRQPDIYTGAGYAHAGILVGLAAGLSCLTLTVVQSTLYSQRAERFVKEQLIPAIAEHDLDSALWWKENPEKRLGLTPEDVRKRYENPNQSNPAVFAMMVGDIAKFVDDLKREPEAKLTFERVERTGEIGVTPFALAVIRVNWPDKPVNADGQHDPRPRGELMGVSLKSVKQGRREMWWVEDYVYPYKSNSYQEKAKPVDDGHGHGH